MCHYQQRTVETHHMHLSRNIKVSGFGVVINYEILMPITSSVVPVSKPLRHTGIEETVCLQAREPESPMNN